MATRHIAIETWLDALNMADYVHLFRQYGGVEDLIHATDNTLADIGITNGDHMAKVISSLRVLRDKLEICQVVGAAPTSPQRASGALLSSPNSPTTSYPDFQYTVASPEKLGSDLQKELSGDPSELSSRSWYHGNITRQKAESLVVNNGDFLIRDCISKPGDFVLTCKWKGVPLNFIINSIISYCSSEALPTISYQFEEGKYPTIQQLIQHYQLQKKPVTVASEAILKSPVPRSMPLSSYDEKYGALISFPTCCFFTPNQSPNSTPFVTPLQSPRTSPNMSRRELLCTTNKPNLKKNGCEDTTTDSDNLKYNRPPSLDNVPIINLTPPGGLPVSVPLHYPDEQNPLKPAIVHIRASSAPALTSERLSNGYDPFRHYVSDRDKISPAISECDLINPPPKPSRVPSVKQKQNPERLARNINSKDNSANHKQGYEATRWLCGCIEPLPQFQRDILKHLSQSSSSDDHEREQSPEYFDKERILPPSQVCGQSAPRLSMSSAGSPNLQKCRLDLNLRVPPVYTFYSDLDQSPPSRTYQIVAQSRSLQSNSNNKENGGNHSEAICKKAGTSKSPRCTNAYLRNVSDVQMTWPEKKDSDKDYLKENVDEDQYIFGFGEVGFLKSRIITNPNNDCKSSIKPEAFTSNLLPSCRKVFDQSILSNVKTILMNKSPKAAALHLTKYDLALTNATRETDLGLGVTSGLELLTLPQGKQLRQDVIERWESLRMLTLGTLLTSQTVNERATILSFWIQTSLHLKTTAGNLFSFAAIMSALNSEHIHRLTDTWLDLRQNHTSSALVFDTKLRPAWTSLNDASSDLPLINVCVPYITPVAQLLERDVESVLQDYYWEKELDPIASAIDVLLSHLDVARVIASQSNLYRSVGKIIMADVSLDPELGQILRPEFHMLLLWGDKSLMGRRKNRLDKLEQVCSLLSQKWQASDDVGTEV